MHYKFVVFFLGFVVHSKAPIAHCARAFESRIIKIIIIKELDFEGKFTLCETFSNVYLFGEVTLFAYLSVTYKVRCIDKTVIS